MDNSSIDKRLFELLEISEDFLSTGFRRKGSVVTVHRKDGAVPISAESNPEKPESQIAFVYIVASKNSLKDRSALEYLDKWLEAIGLSRSSDDSGISVQLIYCSESDNFNLFSLLRNKSVSGVLVLSDGTCSLTEIDSENIKEVAPGYFSMTGQCPVLVTYSPELVLKNKTLRRDVWNHLKTFSQQL